MLKLSRKEAESITLFTDHGEIVVHIGEIRGSQVRIAIDAPDDVDVVRTELLEESG